MRQHLITTPATLQPCRRCGDWTLTGHAEGRLVHAHPIPLNAHEEAQALLDGRSTYNLHIQLMGTQMLLHWRSSFEIAAPRRCPVVTDHRCGRPIGTPHPTPPPRPAPPRMEYDIPF